MELSNKNLYSQNQNYNGWKREGNNSRTEEVLCVEIENPPPGVSTLPVPPQAQPVPTMTKSTPLPPILLTKPTPRPPMGSTKPTPPPTGISTMPLPAPEYPVSTMPLPAPEYPVSTMPLPAPEYPVSTMPLPEYPPMGGMPLPMPPMVSTMPLPEYPPIATLPSRPMYPSVRPPIGHIPIEEWGGEPTQCGYCITPAMAYVPEQKWIQPYTLEEGFQKGTLFPQLDKPFLGGNRR